MDKIEMQMINIVNRNYEIKAFADRLSAISARRRKKGAKK